VARWHHVLSQNNLKVGARHTFLRALSRCYRCWLPRWRGAAGCAGSGAYAALLDLCGSLSKMAAALPS